MLDHPDHEQDNTSDPSPDRLHSTFPPQFGDSQQQRQPHENDYYQHTMTMQPGQQQQMQAQGHYDHTQMMQTSQPHAPSAMTGSFEVLGQVIDPNDPMLDADPFGLSASMHYPTAYSAMEQQPTQR